MAVITPIDITENTIGIRGSHPNTSSTNSSGGNSSSNSGSNNEDLNVYEISERIWDVLDCDKSGYVGKYSIM